MYYDPTPRPEWTKEHKILTKKELHIPNLHMIGWANFITASQKLHTHYHSNMEFVVIIKGKQRYFVNDKYYHLHGGDIFVTYPYEAHGNNGSPQDICEFVWFQLDFTSRRNFLGLVSPYDEFVYDKLFHYSQRTQKAHMKDLPILRNAFQALSSSEMQKQILGYNYFMQFIINNLGIPEPGQWKDHYVSDIQDGVSYIHAHLMDDFDLEMVADYCGLSLSRFKARFKEEMGITPHAYIMALKIDTAKILLKDPQNAITDVALCLGFSSSNHFASTFKKYTNLTPTDFRKQRMPNIY